jgi:hypothetical protein
LLDLLKIEDFQAMSGFLIQEVPHGEHLFNPLVLLDSFSSDLQLQVLSIGDALGLKGVTEILIYHFLLRRWGLFQKFFYFLIKDRRILFTA